MDFYHNYRKDIITPGTELYRLKQEYDSNPKKYDWQYTKKKVMVICKAVKEHLDVAKFKNDNKEYLDSCKNEFAILWTLQNLQSCLKKVAQDKILWHSLSLFKFKEIKNLLLKNASDLTKVISYDNVPDSDKEKKEFEEILNEPGILDDVKISSIDDFLDALKQTTIQTIISNSNPKYGQDKLQSILEEVAEYCLALAKYLNDNQKQALNNAFKELKLNVKTILKNLKEPNTMEKLDRALKVCNEKLRKLVTLDADSAEENFNIIKSVVSTLNIA